MKKLLTTLILAVLTLGAVFGLTACNNDPQYIETKTRNITVGITNAAPMNYKDGNTWVGFDTELTVTVFNALGYNVMFKEIVWENKYIELESKTIDCIWNGFTANSSDTIDNVKKERKDIVNLSRNYMINEQCIVRNVSVAYTDETSLNGKTVAYEIGSSGQAALGYMVEDYELNINDKGVTSQSKALQEIQAGTADFAIVDKSLADNAVTSGYTNVRICDSDYLELEYYAIAFAKTTEGAALRDKVDVLLYAFYQTGYLKELATKYSIDYNSRIKPLFEAVA